MSTKRSPYRLHETLSISALLTFAFTVLYGGANWLAAVRPAKYYVHFPFELSIPFVPAAAPIYLSVQLLLLSLLVFFRSSREIRPVAYTFLFQMVTAAIVFIVCPAQLAFPPPPLTSGWAPLIRLADLLNLEFNLVPSLHVAFAFSSAEMAADKVRGVFQWLFRAWAVLIAVSTVLLHQHHVIDVLTGALLAFVSIKVVYQRTRNS